MECRGEGLERLPRRSVAVEHSSALFQLSNHGPTRYALHRYRGSGGIPVVAWQIVLQPLDAVDSAACLAVPLHREHGWMDDRRNRQAAMAGIFAHADCGRVFAGSAGG